MQINLCHFSVFRNDRLQTIFDADFAQVIYIHKMIVKVA